MKKILAVLVALALPVLALASRNGGGTYSLPAGNPVQTGTTITSTWANNTLSDLSNEMTDSLSRSGKGGMLASLQLVAGTSSAPGFAFTAETNSGFYRAGAGDLRLSIGAVDAARYTAATAYLPALTALTATTLTLKGQVVDGAGNVGVVLDNINALSNATARVASFRSNNVEKAQVRADGSLLIDGSLYQTGGREMVDRYINITANQTATTVAPYTFTTQAVGASETWEVEFFTFYTCLASCTPNFTLSSTATIADWAFVPMGSGTALYTSGAGGTPLVQAGNTGSGGDRVSSQRAVLKAGLAATLTISLTAITNTITILPGSYIRLKRIY